MQPLKGWPKPPASAFGPVCAYCRSPVQENSNCRNCGAPVPGIALAATGRRIIEHHDYSGGVVVTTTLDLGSPEFKTRKAQK
jgi:predicted amidophosphoribosyltransferase